MTAMDEPQTDRRPLLFGRRKGHPLSPRRQRLVDTVLPRLRLDLAAPPPEKLSALFSEPKDEVWLEIGFGGGEHLAWQAEKNWNVGLIGVEPFLNGLANLLARIDEADLDNIRLHDGDAQTLLRWLPPQSLERAFVLFPDPWPKKRHQKRRLLSPETLETLAEVLKPGAELRIATDWGHYASAILIAAAKVSRLEWQATSAASWRHRPEDWPATRYEGKAIKAQRRCYYLSFRRV